MGQKLDFIGLNYYNDFYVKADPHVWPLGFRIENPKHVPVNDRNWPVTEQGLTNMLLRMKNEYGIENIYITENGTSSHDVVSMEGKISDTEMRHLEKLVASYAGSITVRSYPRFNAQVSTLDIKNGISEYRKLKGYNPDIVIVDSMDLLTDANRRSWGADHERAKRIAVANDLKDLAADEKVWMVVTYQSTIEDREWLNDERNVLTEYNCSEAKGLARPCTHLVSLNQSSAERKENVMRLHVAKSRFFKKGDTIRIATDYDNEVFYDGQRTLNLNRE